MGNEGEPKSVVKATFYLPEAVHKELNDLAQWHEVNLTEEVRIAISRDKAIEDVLRKGQRIFTMDQNGQAFEIDFANPQEQS